MSPFCTVIGCTNKRAKGRAKYCPAHASRLYKTGSLNPDVPIRKTAGNELTTMQRLIAICLAEGDSNKGTAAMCGISIKTVEKHREAVYKKINNHTTAGIVHYCLNKGWLENLYARKTDSGNGANTEVGKADLPNGETSGGVGDRSTDNRENAPKDL